MFGHCIGANRRLIALDIPRGRWFIGSPRTNVRGTSTFDIPSRPVTVSSPVSRLNREESSRRPSSGSPTCTNRVCRSLAMSDVVL